MRKAAAAGITAIDRSVVMATISAAIIESRFCSLALATVTTAEGNAAAKIRHIFTSAAKGRQLTIRKVRRGSRRILMKEMPMSFLFFINSLKSQSPSCMPTISMERGVVAPPIISTQSKIIEGSFRPIKSMTMLTTEAMVLMFLKELTKPLK